MPTTLEILREFVSTFPSQKEAALALGMTPALLNNYLKERKQAGAVVREKLQAQGFPRQENDGWSKIKNLPKAMALPNIDESVEIPMLLSTVSAGDPRETFDEIGAYWKPASHYNKDTFMIQARGESMIGAGIMEGHWLIINTEIEARDGDIVVARIGDKLCVKRLKKNGDLRLLHPENARYKPIPVDEKNVEILAVVMSSTVLFRS